MKEKLLSFYHLKKPLTIIASDLCRHTYKEFSNAKTPEMSVAHAVVCSSAFTFFFKLQDNKYTDGGIVSNMPAFALKTSNHFDKILAFNLLSKEVESVNDLSERMKQELKKIYKAIGLLSRQKQEPLPPIGFEAIETQRKAKDNNNDK